MPRVVGKIRRTGPVEVRDMQFLRRNTDRTAKITLPGPFTMSQQAKNEFYKDEEEMVMDYAVAVNAEAHDLVAAGADVIQLDEPWLRNDPEAAKRIAVKAINRALRGPEGADHRASVLRLRRAGAGRDQARRLLVPAAARRHARAEQISIEAAQPKLDLGVLGELAPKKVMLGVHRSQRPDGGDARRSSPTRIRAGLKFVAADKLVPAPDCGMKYLPREMAFAKLKALSKGAAIVRKELSGSA